MAVPELEYGGGGASGRLGTNSIFNIILGILKRKNNNLFVDMLVYCVGKPNNIIDFKMNVTDLWFLNLSLILVRNFGRWFWPQAFRFFICIKDNVKVDGGCNGGRGTFILLWLWLSFMLVIVVAQIPSLSETHDVKGTGAACSGTDFSRCFHL